MIIREATINDQNEIWEIFKNVIKTGDTYVFHPKTTKHTFKKFWFTPYMNSFVAVENNQIVGIYFIKPNQIDLGSHIANAGYMVSPKHFGKGIGQKLCLHSLEVAKKLGYIAMQFNIVVSTNLNAIHLWQKCGFRIIGTIPKAFNHQTLGYVDAYIMYQELG